MPEQCADKITTLFTPMKYVVQKRAAIKAFTYAKQDKSVANRFFILQTDER